MVSNIVTTFPEHVGTGGGATIYIYILLYYTSLQASASGSEVEHDIAAVNALSRKAL